MLKLKQEDIKRYLDEDGDYLFEEDVRFDGGIDFDKPVVFRGSADFRGNADFGGNAYFRGNADFGGYADFGGSADFGGYADFGGNAYFGGSADFRGEYLIVRDTMYWSHISIPSFPEKHYVKFLMPPEWQRDHYQERLGFELTGCYEEIKADVGRKIFNLLKDEKWLPVERKMLECIRDCKKQEPEWVADISVGKEAA